MLTSAIVSGTGFVFWFFGARLFTEAEVGLATTLISSMNLIAMMSLVGFDTVFVRFLATTKDRDWDISTGMILVAVSAFLISTVFILFAGVFSEQLSFVQKPVTAAMFILFSVAMALNIMVDSVFLAYRKNIHKLFNSTFAHALKMVFPFLFVGLGAFGIFAAAASVQLISLVLGVTILIRKFDFRPIAKIRIALLEKVWRFSTVNYFATLFNLIPVAVLPIIVMNNVGTENAAHFFIAMMIGNLIYVVPWSTAGSLFAEGSADEKNIAEHIKKTVYINLLFLTPALVVLTVFSRLILSVFGEGYMAAATLLCFIGYSAFPIMVFSVYSSLLKIKKDSASLLFTNIIYSVVLISSVFIFIARAGVDGVGYAWFLSSSVAALLNVLGYYYGQSIYDRACRGTYVIRHILWFTLVFYFVRFTKMLRGKSPITILCYPQLPQWYHMLYIVSCYGGYALTKNPKAKHDLAFAFEDVTVKNIDETRKQLQRNIRLINGHSVDISKQRVSTVFKEVFGYDLSIDPRTYSGVFVEKSDSNATHDGVIHRTPIEPKEGFVYQKFIDATYDDATTRELRVMIYNLSIPFVLARFRPVTERFKKVLRTECVTVESVLSEVEVNQILEFCRRFGLEYGELDVLRDRDDERLYIVDVNDTAGGPLSGIDLEPAEYRRGIMRHVVAFENAYIKNLK